MPVRLQNIDVGDIIGAAAAAVATVGRPPRSVIVELQLAEGIQPRRPLGGRRDVPHDHSGGVDRHHEVSGVLHRVGLSTVDVGDLEKSKRNIQKERL